MPVVIRVVGLVSGGTTAFDDQFLVEYDPSRPGVEPGSGLPMRAHVVTTPDVTKARRFETAAEAHGLWAMVDPERPVRPSDGEPNRPLTAFTVGLERVP